MTEQLATDLVPLRDTWQGILLKETQLNEKARQDAEQAAIASEAETL